MRKAILLLALLPSLAAAQPMLDPREMSGIPRPDPQVPAGVLTVKVLAGELSAWAPVGTPVHLVAMRGNDVKLTTAKVNDEGRAEFGGLALDGKTAYYALAIFGEDRLISQAAILPPRVGIRMMLAGRKRGKDGQPIGPRLDDEQQGHEGVPDAPPPVPPGDVEVVARGRIAPGAKLVVRELSSGATQEAKLEGGDDDRLGARVSGLEASPDRVYVAEVGNYRTSPFMMAPQGGVRRMILAYDGLLFAIQGGAQPEDEKLWFELGLTVANLSSAPVDPGPEGLLIPLPAGFASVNLGDEQTRFTVEPGLGLRYRGSVAPGQLDVTAQFSLAVHDGKVAVDMPAPLGMFQSQIFLAKAPGMVVSPPAGGEAPNIRRADDGREYFVLGNLTVSPGESLRFEIAGLPVPDRWQAVVKLLAGLLVVGLVTLAFAAAVRRPRGQAGRGVVNAESTRRELGIRRERLYAELVALERARQSQRIDEAAFAAHRRAIMAKLVLVHRELDDLEGGKQANAS